MKAETASRSAGIIAAHRAIESSKDLNERICHDPFAHRFLPPGFTVIGESEIPEKIALKIFMDLVPGFHEFFLARTRYIDDYLQCFLSNDLEQLVILGAGYDSRAYRFDALKNGIKIFEIDHPATQTIKKEKLLEIFKTLPDHVTFVPVDLRKDELGFSLYENGYDHRLKTLFIWEGVTMYIDQQAVDEMLVFISKNSGKGSAVIFDYTYPDVINGSNERKEAKEWLKKASQSDEPLHFGISDNDVQELLVENGFQNIECATSDYFNNRYFTGPNEIRKATPILSIVHAEVKDP